MSAAVAGLQLPGELTIYAAAELRAAWLAWVDALPADAHACAVDGSGVDLVDACGLQLLVSLGTTLANRQCALVVERPSTALAGACAALGLDHLMYQPAGAAA